jgi:hypothetical protein
MSPWNFYHWAADAKLAVSIESTSWVGVPSPFSDYVLRVHNGVGGFEAFYISQRISPCPGVSYILKATVRANVPTGTNLYAFLDIWERTTGPKTGWTQIYETRQDYEPFFTQTTYEFEIGLNNPYNSLAGAYDGLDLAGAFHLRVVPPDGSTVPWTVFVDHVRLVAINT